MIILLCSLCKCRAFVGPRIFGGEGNDGNHK